MNRQTECPLCGNGMQSLWHDTTPEKKGYHHWCKACNHGFYINDLRNIAGQNLEYTASRGHTGKSPEQMRQIIRETDARNPEGVGE